VPFLLQCELRRKLELGTVAAGGNRSFFVDANGALLACGREDEGGVGLLGVRGGDSQTAFEAVVPTPVPSMAGVRIRAVSCHDDCNLALSEAGQVFAWGGELDPLPPNDASDEWRLAPVPTVIEELRGHRVRQVAAGLSHCAAVTEDGALFTWQISDDDTGEAPPELGLGSYVDCDLGVPYPVLALKGVRIAAVALGNGFTVTVTETGAVYSFGRGDGRLGNGEGDEFEGMYLPKRIEALDGIHVASVAAGVFHALALTRCGQV
jgi:alpha-tubulin suppressor-like RCC1 family protein